MKTAFSAEKDTNRSLQSRYGHLQTSVLRCRSDASSRRAMLPIALLSKKNLTSRLAIGQTDESCVLPSLAQKVSATPQGLRRQNCTSFGIRGPWLACTPGSSPLLGVGRSCHLHYVTRDLDTMEGPLNILPRIQQSDGAPMRATCWMACFCQLQ